MKDLFFNCRSGISGDMVVAALLDLMDNIGGKFTNSSNYLISELAKLPLEGYKLKIKRITTLVSDKKNRGLRFIISAKKEVEHRNIEDIFEIIERSRLSLECKHLAKQIFFNLAVAEANVHKTKISKVHFHEIGAVDSIIDIVSTAILITRLRPKSFFCGTIIEGSGFVSTQHGRLSVPVPAVQELLSDFPIEITKIKKELVTPTGAAILKTLVHDFASLEDVFAYKNGFGFGNRKLPSENSIELRYGTIKREHKILLETNIDDMSPEIYPYLIEKLIKKGAVDAFISPCFMKKERIGTLLTVICTEYTKERLIDVIFNETTTFGIRINKVSRAILDRQIKDINGLKVKVGKWKGKIVTISPEYESAKKLALKENIPLKRFYTRQYDVNNYVKTYK
ncbi:MAG: nickel pincer cofactor biosynthesis protein LarC [Candidatus Woesearchaeota archaeon]